MDHFYVTTTTAAHNQGGAAAPVARHLKTSGHDGPAAGRDAGVAPREVSIMRASVRRTAITLALAFFGVGCGSGDGPVRPPPPAPEGGSSGTGGSGGAVSGYGGNGGGSGGSSAGGSSGSGGASTGGSSGSGGSGGAMGGSGGASPADASPSDAQPAGNDGPGAPLPPSAPGQGPVAEGKIVYSQDFEQNMDGISRSPNGLPADRAAISDDPLGMRGKIMKVEWRSGDNFRTSGGTEPRNWISSRPGNEFRPGAKMSHAFGFMWSGPSTDYAFAQVISSGGPVWMLIVEGGGTLTVFCNTCGGNTRHMQLAPNKWYDFRVDIDFNVGGPVNFFLNGQMFRQGRMTSTRGDIAHWDGGIYNRAAGTAGNKTRQSYISNLSIGQR
jgi:hypothetical protein